MRAADFFRDKALHLSGVGFAVLFTAVLLAVLRQPPAAAAFLCLVEALCALIPLALEFARKRRFYNEVLPPLEALEEKYLISALLSEPHFTEGMLFCQALGKTSKAMTDAVADARRDMSEYREYIETWVHEVKTPIASARLALENHPGALAQCLEEDLFQIDAFVEQALFYARSGAVERDYLIRAMPLRDTAAAAVKKYAGPLIDAGFSVDLDSLTATVYSDPKWVEFILGQLLSNALKYRGENPHVSFLQREEDASVVLVLQDNGRGIPAADLPRVFDKGFTGVNGRALPTRSTGLGLYLCKKLCDRLGPGIEVDSSPGQGVSVSLVFPKGRFHLAE